MKLSTIKKLGYVQCRGGRLLEVAHDHQVRTDTLDTRNDGGGVPAHPPCDQRGCPLHGAPQFAADEPWVTAKVGDLAIEICSMKAGTVMGHAYLSGRAERLFRYTGTPAHWFAEAAGWKFDPFPMVADDTEEQVIAKISACLAAPVRAVVWNIPVEDVDHVHQALGAMGNFATRATKPEGSRVHFIGSVTHKKGRNGTMHMQPPAEASPWCVQPFHIQLLLTSPNLARKLTLEALAPAAP